MGLTSFEKHDEKTYQQFKSKLAIQGIGINDFFNDIIDKVAKQQTTTLENFDKPNIPDLFADIKEWKKYKADLSPKEWEKFDRRVQMLIKIANDRRSELISLGEL